MPMSVPTDAAVDASASGSGSSAWAPIPVLDSVKSQLGQTAKKHRGASPILGNPANCVESLRELGRADAIVDEQQSCHHRHFVLSNACPSSCSHILKHRSGGMSALPDGCWIRPVVKPPSRSIRTSRRPWLSAAQEMGQASHEFHELLAGKH